MGGEAANRIELMEPPLGPRERLHVLKHDDLFAVFDAWGDFYGSLHQIGPSIGADGLFQDDTRILSRLTLRISGAVPELLSGTIGRDNVVFSAHLTNPTFRDRSGRLVPPSQMAIQRRRLLWNRTLYEVLHVRNYSNEPILADLEIEVAADFRDVFEIRGMARSRRGEMLPPHYAANSLTLAYRGLDGETRRTAFGFSVPVEIKGQRIRIPFDLAPGETRHVTITVSGTGEPASPDRISFLRALKQSKRTARATVRRIRPLTTSNAAFEAWLDRSASDLSLLVSHLSTGPYPYAGIPWFSAPFGRDAVVTAMQVLWLDPSIARGVLAHLSALQAAEQSNFHDSEPGKIVHEMRKGEMAALHEVPFGRYYGGVDTTPLFVMLAGAYLKRTNDVSFARDLWPAVRAALDWMENFGDADRDGFIEYRRGAESGLSNQGWKDSHDSIFHAGGELAQGAIAVVEVQAYAVAANLAAAQIAALVGETVFAESLERKAARLAAAIDERFWSEAIGTYAVALDGGKRQCAVRTSNAGHVLFCGAASPERAERVGRALMAPDLFSGWGIRTVATGERLYNPLSYHNGTVWPHDCSIIAAGLARYGMGDSAAQILTGLFDVACRLPEFRMPELFCGFPRRAGEGPVSFPSACTPQAWASGAVFLMLQACLAIGIDATSRVIEVGKPHLPDWLERVSLRHLPVGAGSASVHFHRQERNVEVRIADVEGDVRLARKD
jgi:glycogen debranching enzyme